MGFKLYFHKGKDLCRDFEMAGSQKKCTVLVNGQRAYSQTVFHTTSVNHTVAGINTKSLLWSSRINWKGSSKRYRSVEWRKMWVLKSHGCNLSVTAWYCSTGSLVKNKVRLLNCIDASCVNRMPKTDINKRYKLNVSGSIFCLEQNNIWEIRKKLHMISN